MLNLSGIKKTYNRGDVTRMCLFDGFDLSVKDGERSALRFSIKNEKLRIVFHLFACRNAIVW